MSNTADVQDHRRETRTASTGSPARSNLAEQNYRPGTEYARSIARSRQQRRSPPASSWSDTLQDGVSLLREHPMIAAGVVLATGLLFSRAPSQLSFRGDSAQRGKHWRDDSHIRSGSAYATLQHIKMDEKAETLFVTGLRNAHSLETEAEQIIGRQLERLVNYRQLAERLHAHLDETRMQKERLERILARYSASPSTLKETATTLMGNMAAIAHTTAADEVLKNTFANLAFENFEIGAYRSLIAMAETYGQRDAIGLLRQSLAEEVRMATWLDENVGDITREFMTLRAHDEKADR